MTSINNEAAPGWVGGFAESNPAFGYPDLTSLPMLGNMDNIKKLKRQQKVIWPEFSWETIQGKPESRCFQKFSPDISRLGYDNRGRVWSIICPQQGTCFKHLGCMNLEVTVTGQRGWADETTREVAVDMTVEGAIWFTSKAWEFRSIKWAADHFTKIGKEFPLSKEHAIKVTTHKPGNPNQPIFPGRKGLSTGFNIPNFAKHPEAWAVGNLAVQIGPVKKTGHHIVDWFNQEIVDIFNKASGNILQENNVLTWNLWFTAPEPVCTKEWTGHAEKWRKSIDADHGSPTGPGSKVRYIDGREFDPIEHEEHEVKNLFKELEKRVMGH